jgi:hypothetical protein
MLVNALYNVVDRIFVGQGVNEIALGGLSLVMPLMTINMAIAMHTYFWKDMGALGYCGRDSGGRWFCLHPHRHHDQLRVTQTAAGK